MARFFHAAREWFSAIHPDNLETMRVGRQMLQYMAAVYVVDQHVLHLSMVSPRGHLCVGSIHPGNEEESQDNETMDRRWSQADAMLPNAAWYIRSSPANSSSMHPCI